MNGLTAVLKPSWGAFMCATECAHAAPAAMGSESEALVVIVSHLEKG